MQNTDSPGQSLILFFCRARKKKKKERKNENSTKLYVFFFVLHRRVFGLKRREKKIGVIIITPTLLIPIYDNTHWVLS